MTAQDVFALLPFLILTATAVLVMLLIAFRRDYRTVTLLSVTGLVAAVASLPVVSPSLPRQITPLMIFDGTALFYLGLLLVTGLAVVALSYEYLEDFAGQREEYYILLLLAILGAGVLVVSDHFVSFFLGLEILSVGLYALIAYPRAQDRRVEAGVKYLILAGATSAFLLFGMALVYNELGTMSFTQIAAQIPSAGAYSLLLLAGFGLITVGIGFKLALVPFHMWTPDVYQGAPAPVTALVATVSKGGVFALMLRYFSAVTFQTSDALWSAFAIVAIASMLTGNILALVQDNLKRILAYSSIAHLGYLLVAFLASGPLRSLAVAFYLVAYFATTVSGFGVVTVLSKVEKEREALEEYRGLFWTRPWLALLLTLSMLSLAGIPPTAGLIGKIYVAAAGVESALWLLLIVLVISSVIGVFYYLRVVITVFRKPEVEAPVERLPVLPATGGLILAVLGLVILWLGVYPAPLIQVIERTVAGLP